MATFTATELKANTTIPVVSSWTDAKALQYQTIAESILSSFDLDSSVSGYSDKYESALILMFDFIVQNPTGLSSSTNSKTRKQFAKELPITLQTLINDITIGSEGMSVAQFKRDDIGRY